MEFTKEFIEENQLTPEQVNAVKGIVVNHIAEEKKVWDGVANENAEKIIGGAASKVEELTGIQREKGQKIADYLSFASEKFFEGTKSSLQQKQAELENKLKNVKGDDSLKAELQEVKTKLDELKQKEAIYSEYEKEDYKGKYIELNEKISKQEIDIAFNSVKPSFPPEANKYEVKGRWNEFVSDVQNKYHIKRDEEGKAIAIDKENEYKIVKLSELVEKNEELNELVKGRQVTGIGTKTKENISVDGVPFKVPKDATAAEKQAVIKDYLMNVKKLPITSDQYSKLFAEYNIKLMEKIPV